MSSSSLESSGLQVRRYRKFFELDGKKVEWANAVNVDLDSGPQPGHAPRYSIFSKCEGASDVEDDGPATAVPSSSPRSFMRRMVNSRGFIILIANMIVLNSIYIGVEADLADDKPDFPWYAAEVVFTLVFLVELLLRIVASTNLKAFVLDAWNIFDCIIVAVSCVDSLVLALLLGAGGELQVVSAARTLRLARVVRIFRLFRLFGALWDLVSGIVGAMFTLLWAWVLLALLIYIFSVFAVRTFGQSYSADDPKVAEYFGTIPRSMFTLFQVTTTEGWADIARTTMRRAPWTAIFFVLYLYVTTFAAMNVVVAVIVENTLDHAGSQRQKFLAKQRAQQEQAFTNIYQLFRSADSNQDGHLSKEEFLRQIRQDEVRTDLTLIGINIGQAENLFDILDYDESGSLDADEFMGGMLKAVGPARAKDVLAVRCDSRRSERKVWGRLAHLKQVADEEISAVERGVQLLRRDVTSLVQALSACGVVTSQDCSPSSSQSEKLYAEEL